MPWKGAVKASGRHGTTSSRRRGSRHPPVPGIGRERQGGIFGARRRSPAREKEEDEGALCWGCGLDAQCVERSRARPGLLKRDGPGCRCRRRGGCAID